MNNINEKKNVTVSITITETQKEFLLRECKAEDFNISQYIRKLISNQMKEGKKR